MDDAKNSLLGSLSIKTFQPDQRMIDEALGRSMPAQSSPDDRARITSPGTAFFLPPSPPKVTPPTFLSPFGR